MKVLSLKNVTKSYGSYLAVNHVSFDVEQGTIFGLLGPNGAGKTSMIRIITSITAPDSGEILLNGEPLNSLHPHQIGYMPEERGLYKKMKVGEQLMYLAQLKGLSRKNAKERLFYWLDKFDIRSWWDKKISELSKGMSQKVQFIATVVHDPKLIILDEPFSGLDPVNANLIKDEIYELKEKGASILFSTHRMEQVEEICQEIVLIHKGQIILNGNVAKIKNDFKENKYRVTHHDELPGHIETSGIKILEQNAHELIFETTGSQSANDLLSYLISKDVHISGFNEILPSLNEIFIRQVSQ
jgi:ABC-2 type transport system ATP-binding protein